MTMIQRWVRWNDVFEQRLRADYRRKRMTSKVDFQGKAERNAQPAGAIWVPTYPARFGTKNAVLVFRQADPS